MSDVKTEPTRRRPTTSATVKRSSVRPVGTSARATGAARPSAATTTTKTAAAARKSSTAAAKPTIGSSSSTRRRRASGAAAPNAADALPVSPSDLTADTMKVTNRVAAASRCAAVGEDGTVWTGEADGSIVIRLPPYGAALEKIPPDQPRSGRPAQVSVLHRVENKMWAAYTNGTVKVFSTVPTPDGSVQQLHESHQLTSVVHAMCDINGHVYSAGGDWKIYMYDADDYHYTRLLFGHSNSIRALAAYTDPESHEERVVSAGDDGAVKIWNPHAPSQKDKDTACVATIDMPNKVGVWSLTALQDTMELWVGCDDGVIRVYDLYSKLCSAQVEGHTAPVVALHPVDDNVWSAAKNGTLLVVDRFTKEVGNVVKQPASGSSGGGGGGAGRFNVCIQPVQRTVVNNVWVTNPEGSWQCWSQLSAESVADGPAGRGYHGLHLDDTSSTAARGASATHTAAQATDKQSNGAVNHTRAAADSSSSQREKEDIAAKVASLRRTVQELESEAASVAEENPVEEADSEEDEAARLDLIEESIRRDRAEAMQETAEPHGDSKDAD